MKIKEGFFIKRIGDEVYLLPYGNRIASFTHGLRLVGSSQELAARLLDGSDATRDALLDELVISYGAHVSKEELARDLDEFLTSLQRLGILEGCVDGAYAKVEGTRQVFSIAGIRLALDAPEELVHPLLRKFACDESNGDITISLASYERSRYPEGRILLRSRDVVVYEGEDSYGILYPENIGVREVVMSKDGTIATLFLKHKEASVAEEIFLAIRSVFLLYARKRQLYAIHSVSVDTGEGVVLFSGVSGSGKSTHSRLWEKQFGMSVLNGDLNLIGFEQGMAKVYGIPWCGTSGIAEDFTRPLLGVFFIQQSSENHCDELLGADRTLALANRMISPTWTKEGYASNLDFANLLQEHLMLATLQCTMDPQAAQVAYDYLKRYLRTKESNL